MRGPGAGRGQNVKLAPPLQTTGVLGLQLQCRRKVRLGMRAPGRRRKGRARKRYDPWQLPPPRHGRDCPRAGGGELLLVKLSLTKRLCALDAPTRRIAHDIEEAGGFMAITERQPPGFFLAACWKWPPLAGFVAGSSRANKSDPTPSPCANIAFSRVFGANGSAPFMR